LPDGLFSNQKSQFGKKFSGPQIGKCLYILWPFGVFYGSLGYFMTIRYILCSFGTFSGFAIIHKEKSGNPEIMHKEKSGNPELESKLDSRTY
jgi:hypothetical protein